MQQLLLLPVNLAWLSVQIRQMSTIESRGVNRYTAHAVRFFLGVYLRNTENFDQPPIDQTLTDLNSSHKSLNLQLLSFFYFFMFLILFFCKWFAADNHVLNEYVCMFSMPSPYWPI